MKLTPTEINAIKRAAELLRQYRKDLANNQSSKCVLHAILLNKFEGYIDGVVDILLTKSPGLGESVKTQCDELLNAAKMVGDLSDENPSEATHKELELMGNTRRLSIRFQRIAEQQAEGQTINKKSQKKLRREADIAAILDKKPNIKIDELASKLEVSKATVSRSKVWHQHKARPPKDQFPDSVSTEED